MHILFISSSPEKVLNPEYLQSHNSFKTIQISSLETYLNTPHPLDIIFFDGDLGEENIVAYLHKHHHKLFPAPWFVINIEQKIQLSLRYLQAGASGILKKNCDTETLQKIIKHIATKRPYLEDELTQALALRQIKKMLSPFSLLTTREFDIFCLLAEGFSIPYIAHELSISTKTAFNCQTQLRQKLDLKKKNEITQFAKDHGLII